MTTDQYGRMIFSEDDLCGILLRNPEQTISGANALTTIHFHPDLELEDPPLITCPTPLNISVEQFDADCQSNWHMPTVYKELDIAKYVLDLCKTQEELQRVGTELLLYQERNLFPLLQYLKYLVDTMREHGIVWGVGRGSSVSSYVLFLLGVHKIDSIFYDLPITEFLR
jgi:hypothetical protein